MLKKKSHISRTLITLLWMVVLNVLLGATDFGATKTWVPTAGGAWTTAANWNPNGAPAVGDDVTIPADQSANITAVPTITLNSLTINGTCTFASAANGNTITISTTFSVAASKTFTLSGTFNNRPNITLAATATGTVNGTITEGNAANTFTNNGILIMPPAGIIGGAGVFVNAAGATLQVGSTLGITTVGSNTGNIQVTTTRTYTAGANYIYNGTAAQVTGNGLIQNTPLNLTINNSAGVALSAATTISGLLTMTSGTLDMANTNLTVGSLTGSGNLTHSSGAAGARTLTIGSDGTSPAAYSGVISNGTATSVAVTKNGAGTLTLSGANTYTGLTTQNAGTLSIANTAGLGPAGNALTLAGGTLDLNTDVSVNAYNVTVSAAATIQSDKATAASAGITHTFGTLNTNGSILTIAGGSNVTSGIAGVTFGDVTKTGANTFTVNDPVGGGTTQLSVAGVTGNFLTTINGSGDVIQTGVWAGTGGITYGGTGTLTLSQANTYTGATTINSGTLKLGASSAVATSGPLGTTGAGTTVTAGAVLDLNGFSLTAAATETLTLNGTGIAAGGALTNSSATAASYSGLIALGSTGVSIVTNAGDINITNAGTITGATFGLTLGGSGNGSITSIIGTTTGTVTKAGTGTWTLSGASTYTGLTTISAGTLKLGASSAVSTSGPLGTTGTGTTITAGAVLDLNGFSLTAAATEALTLNGTGLTASPAGALTNTGAAASYLGTITLGSASTITATPSGTLTVAAVTNGTLALTLDGAGTGTVSGVIGASTGTVTKNGAGTWTLSGANTYTGATTVNAGTLKAGVATQAFGLTSAVTLANTSGVVLDITGFANTIGSLTGGGVTGGNVTLGAATLTIGSDGTSPAAYAGVISGTGAIIKNGAGTLTLSGINTYTGLTTVSAGILKLGAAGDGTNTPLGTIGAGTTVSSGATLDLNGITLSTAEALSIVGTGASVGALTNSSATAVSYSGLITLTAASTIATNAGDINITNAGTITGAGLGLTLGGTGNGSVTSIIGTTTGSVTKSGTGTWTLSGANTYTGVTTISAGVLSVGTIGNGGVAGNLGAATNAAANLVLGGGTLQYTGATASTNRNFTLIAGTNSTIDVTTNNLTISGASTNTTGALTKIGIGTLTLSGTNLYTGLTTINAGTLQNGASNVLVGAVTVNDGGTYDLNGYSDAIGALTVNSGTTGGTVKTSAGTLTLGGNVTSTGGAANALISGNLALGATRTFTLTNAADGLTVSAIISGVTFGVTKTGAGALTLSGTNTYTGVTTINAGVLSVAAIGNGGVAGNLGAATNAAANLVLGGGTLQYTGATTSTDRSYTLTAGTTSTIDVTTNNLTISGASTNTTGSLTKIGNGTLTLSGTNLYTGVTTINAGVLSVATIGNGGVAGNLGAATNAAANLVLGGGTLQYTGATASTDRSFTLTAATNSSIDVPANNLTISGANINTTGAMTKIGNGTLSFSTNDVTLNGLTISVGTLISTSGSLNLVGNFSNNGTFTANGGTVNFNGSTAQTIGGTSTSTFNNLIINNASGVSLSASASVAGTLTFTSGILTTSGYLLTITNTAVGSITGASSASYINGPLALTLLANIAADGTTYLYPVGENGNYRPLELVNIRTGAPAPVVKVTISGTGASTCDETTITSIAPRNWYVQSTSGIFTSAFVRLTESGLLQTRVIGTSSAQSGNYVSVGGSNIGSTITSSQTVLAASLPAYFAIGNSLVLGLYSYQSGDWGNASTWTTDASGNTQVNSRIPGILDNVTIINGRTISISANTKQVNTLTLNSGGILDIASTSGHNFGTVTGQGKLLLSSNNFPGGTYTSFVASNGGTIEYYNLNGVAISTTQFTYNNLIISNTSSSPTTTAFLINNANPTTYVINGNFAIKKDPLSTSNTLYFGNATASDNLINMTVYGDFTVDAGCNIRVNNFATSHAIPDPANNTTAYPVHTLSLYGNLTNNGSIRFTGLPSPVANAYYLLGVTASGGINYGDVQVFFYGATNNTVTCNGITDFYRLIVAKGTDKTYTLEVSSSNTNNFALYAPNDQGTNNFNGGPEGFGYGAYYKALFINYGTLKLNENINIPSLTEGGQDFNIIPTAELWVNGANVSTTLTGVNGSGYQAATLYGTLRISAGQFSTGDAAGMVLGILGTPAVMIDGTGTLDASQVWTSTGGTNQISYIQTGGTANFRLLGENHAGPMFGLSNINSTFTMSAGIINFTNNAFADASTDFQIMDIESQAGNYNVTGGTININLPSSATVYTANSTVPFYNVNISNKTGTGTTTVQWNTPGPSLSVLHDLTIGNLSVLNLNTSTISLSVGHDFTISSGGTYTPSTTLTTTFNGTGTQAFNNAGTITGGLNNLTITNSSLTSIINNNVIVNGALFIDQNSVLNDSGKTVTVSGNIINSGTHISRVSTGAIILTGTAAQTLSGNGTGIFNNLTLNKTGGSVTMTANMAVTGNLRLAGGTAGVWNILNIGSYSLVLGSNTMVYSDGTTGTTFAYNRMIQTSGLLSDGGVSKTYSSTTAFIFPFGFYNTANTTYYYMPQSIQFSSAPTAYGTVTTHPVNSRHPLAQGANNALTCYWKTTSTGFTGVPAGSVINNYYYDYAATNYFVSGTETNYIPAVYSNSTWNTINNVALVIEATNQVSYNTADIADGEYTAGQIAAFTAIPTLYSVASGPWNNASTWSMTRGGAAGAGTPTASNLVIICSPYTVTTPLAASSSSLTIESGATLDLGNVNGHNFGSIPVCSGTLRIASTAYFPTGDWGNFLGTSGGTVEYYQTAAGTLTLPTTYTLPGGGTANITGYYNLITSPYNASNIILPNSNLMINNNLTVGYSSGGGTSSCITQINVGASSTTLEVKGNIAINQYGILQYQNNLAEYAIADNDITIAAGGALQVRNGGNSVANTLTVYGNIVNNGTFDLDSNYPTNDNYYCNLIFTGSLSKFVTSTSAPTRTRLYSITVNKGTSRDSILNVNVDPTGFQMGGGGLNLQNGTFRLTSNVTMPLSTGGLTIPSTACLSANGGTFNIATVDAAADLSLLGRLELLAGVVNIGPGIASASANAFNIVYASAGTPEIIISGGSLNVYSQIRRGTGTTSGSLNYTQTGGAVTIGGKNSSTSRAVFEVLNSGSKFTMSNGSIIIANHISAASPYDVYLDPDIENVTGGTIQFGLSTSITTSNTFYFQSSCSIGNILLEATTNSSATQEIYPLTLVGSLTIGGTASYYNTNGLDVTIGGNLTNNNTSAAVGLNVGGYRTLVLTQSTGFVGSIDQTITGTASNLTNFADMDVATAAGHNLSLSSSTITVNGDLTLTSGTLNDNGNIITVLNNVDNNATHYSSSANGGMIFNGTITQGITGNGSGVFGNIQINNSGHGVNMTDNSTINSQLKFTNGYLYISNYALTLGEGASIVGADGTNHINLNGVSSDAGVIKRFPTGASSFTFPIGDNGKYTPCTYNFTSNTNSSGATITVIPVNALHPTINSASYTNYLKYYWKVAATGFSPSTYNVTETYTFIPADRAGNPANIERCDNSTSVWSTVSPGTISSPTFSFSCTTLLDGSYTIGDIFVSLPILYSTKSGNWNDATVWSPSYVPNGNSVVINAGHTVTLSVNGASASSVDIEGVLDALNTVSHNIGQVSGTGKIRMSPTGSAMFAFPGGSYDAFLANSTSTVEFYGNTDGTMPLDPGNINKPYQQVIFSGTGKKYISSVDTKVNGNLTISDGSKLDNTLYNKDLFILGNWIDQNTGTAGFTAGSGTVHFSGSTAQTITMSGNSMKETFYNLEINNAAGLTISTGTVDISDQLLLTLGNINFASLANNILTITNTSSNAVVGGSINSFVNGPLGKKILNGSSFQFPVGDANSSSRNRFGYVSVSSTSTSGTQTWTAQFFDKNPTAGGYDITQMVSPLQSVVNNEYWNIIGPTGGSANVVLSWDQYTGMSSSASTRALTRVAEWIASWNSVGQVVTDNGQISGTVATSTLISLGNHIFTIGGANNIVPLLITSIASGDWNSVTTWNYQVPTSMDTVHISNNIAITLNTGATVTKLIVDNGGSFDNSGSFTVINNVYIGSGSNLTIESGASISAGKIILNDGSNYINLSSSTPTLQVMRTISGTEGWRMLAAPDNVNVGSMFTSPFVTQGFTGSSFSSLQPNLMWWDETSQGTSLQAWRQPSGNSDAVILGKGYMFYVFNGALRPDVASNYSDVLPLTMTATGTESSLNPTAFDFSVTATARSATSHDTTYVDTNAVDYGWNLVGNPTPSTINWNASGWTKTNMDGTIYIWNPAINSYETWNGTTGNLGSGKIAPFQAFWVKANAATPSLKCSNGVKTMGGTFLGKVAARNSMAASVSSDTTGQNTTNIAQSVSLIKSTSVKTDTSLAVSTPILDLELSANGQQTQAYLMFSHGGKLTYDPYDAFSLVPLSNNYLILYSVAGTDQPAMQIQNLPDTGYTQPLTLPLYVGGTVSGQPLSGSFTLSWKLNGQLPTGWNILLMDDGAGTATSMTEAGELTFQYATPADLISSGSSLLPKESGVASSGQSLQSLPWPVVQTVPAGKLAKSSTSASRFRIVVASNNDMKGYLPTSPQLAQNYPNPFNPTTNITFSIPSQTRVTIRIFNILGQQVATVTDQEYTAGSHLVVWNATHVASGVYFCRMSAAEITQTKKMVVLR